MAAAKKVAFEVEVKTSNAEQSVEGLKDDFKDLNKESKEFGAITKKGSKEMEKGFAGASEQAKQLGGALGGAATGAIGFVAGIKSMTKAALAFVMTPIGAVITAIALALGALTSWFNKTEKGAQTLRVIMAALGAVINEVMDFVFALGGAYMKLIKLDVKGAAIAYKDALVGLADGMANSVTAAVKLESALNSLKVSNRELAVETAEARSEIKQLNKDAEDVTLSFEQRAEAAQRAGQIEDQLLAKRLANAEENVRIITEQNALSASSEDELQKLADAEIALANTRSESLELQTTIQNKLNAIRQGAAAAEKAARDKAVAALKAQRLVEAKVAADRKREHDENIKRLEEEAELRRKLGDQVAQKEVEIYEALRDTKVQLEKDEEEREIAAARLKLTRRLETIMGANEKEVELREQLETISGIEIQAIKDKHAAAAEAKNESHNARMVAQDTKLAETKIQVAQTVGNVLGNIAALINDQSREGVIAAKVLGAAQIAIDAAVAVSGAIAQAQSVPYPGNLVAIGTGVAAVLAAIASASSLLGSANVPGPSPNISGAQSIASSAPTAPQVTTSTSIFGEDQISQIEIAPVQAFVVESEMTQSQYNIEQIQGQAAIGPE